MAHPGCLEGDQIAFFYPEPTLEQLHLYSEKNNKVLNFLRYVSYSAMFFGHDCNSVSVMWISISISVLSLSLSRDSKHACIYDNLE